MEIAAAAQLLFTSHLRVDLDDYWCEATGRVDWGRLMEERGYSGSEVTLIKLAEDLAEGALSDVRYFDERNYAALLSALSTLRPSPAPGSTHLRAA